MRFIERCSIVAMLLCAGIASAQVDPSPSRIGINPLPLPPSPDQPAGRWTAQQLEDAFNAADADGNGELTRAEAQHLTIMPRSFEEMDTDKDGVVSRAEFEEAARAQAARESAAREQAGR